MSYSQQYNKSKQPSSPGSLYDQKAAVSYNSARGYSKADWKNIQARLNDAVHSNLVVDGIPGKLTADSVYKFQSYKGMSLKDGKVGPGTKAALGLTSYSDIKGDKKPNPSEQSDQKVAVPNQKVTIPSGATIMSKSYTPDLDLLKRHAAQEGYDVKDIGTSANYVAKYCTGSSSQRQCTRGTALLLQLASYARGEAKKTYASSCAAHLFGSTNPMTNYNISSGVAGEYTMSSADNKTGKSNMNSQIKDNLKKDGEFVTFQYASSQHIVFRSNGSYFSDFKQGTPTGCGGESTKYSNIHYFKR